MGYLYPILKKTTVREASEVTFKPRNLRARLIIIKSLAPFYKINLKNQGVLAHSLALMTVRIMTKYKPMVKGLWFELSNAFARKSLWNVFCARLMVTKMKSY